MGQLRHAHLIHIIIILILFTLCLLTLKVATGQRGFVLWRWKHNNETFIPALVLYWRSCYFIITGAGSGVSAAIQRPTGAAAVRAGYPPPRPLLALCLCMWNAGQAELTAKTALHIKLKTPAFIGLTCSVCTVQFIFNSTRVWFMCISARMFLTGYLNELIFPVWSH